MLTDRRLKIMHGHRLGVHKLQQLGYVVRKTNKFEHKLSSTVSDVRRSTWVGPQPIYCQHITVEVSSHETGKQC